MNPPLRVKDTPVEMTVGEIGMEEGGTLLLVSEWAAQHYTQDDLGLHRHWICMQPGGL